MRLVCLTPDLEFIINITLILKVLADMGKPG